MHVAWFGTAPWLLLDPLVVTMCSVSAGEGAVVFCSVSCAFCRKGPLASHSQAQHKAMSLLPYVPPAVHEVV